MRGSRLSRVGLIGFATLFGGFAAYFESKPVAEPSGTTIVIEVEDGSGIGTPFRVVTDGPGKTKFLKAMPPSDGNEVAHRLPEPISYRFHIAKSGVYYLWARTRWENLCANSFALRIDGAVELRLGNDEEFGKWHWVKHPMGGSLDRGHHTLEILLVEPLAEIDKIVLTDVNVPPTGDDEFIGFDDSFESDEAWLPNDSAQWSVLPNKGLALRPLVRESAEFTLHESKDIETGHVTVQFDTRSDTDVAVVFGYRGPRHYDFVQLHSDRLELGTARPEGTTADEVTPPVKERPFLATKNGQRLELRIESNRLRLWYSGILVLDRSHRAARGQIGVGSRAGDVVFRRVRVMPLTEPSLSLRFHLDFLPLDQISGVNPVQGRWQRSELFSTPFTYSAEAFASAKGPATVLAGDPTWIDYRVEVVVRGLPGTWSGPLFHAVDVNNYFWLRARPGTHEDPRGEVQLLRRRNGIDKVLSSVPVDLPPNVWRVASVTTSSNRIRAVFDRVQIADLSDVGAAPGLVGLQTSLAGGTPPDTASRPIALMSELVCAGDFEFDHTLHFPPKSMGGYLVFHYVDAQSYHFAGLEREGESDPARWVFGRRSGGKRTIYQQRGPATPEQAEQLQRGISGGGQYWLGVRRSGDRIVASGAGGLTASATVGTRGGRVGIASNDPRPHAQYDEFFVSPVPESPRATETSSDYHFNPAGRAAHDLSDWSTREGEWGIGQAAGKLHYILFGRTGSEGRARLIRRVRTVGLPSLVDVSFGPIGSEKTRLQIGFHRQVSANEPALEATVEVHAGAAKLTIDDGGELPVARKDLSTRTEDHLSLSLEKDGEDYAVCLNGQTIHRLPRARVPKDSFISVSVGAAPETVVGVSRISIR